MLCCCDLSTKQKSSGEWLERLALDHSREGGAALPKNAFSLWAILEKESPFIVSILALGYLGQTCPSPDHNYASVNCLYPPWASVFSSVKCAHNALPTWVGWWNQWKRLMWKPLVNYKLLFMIISVTILLVVLLISVSHCPTPYML